MFLDFLEVNLLLMSLHYIQSALRLPARGGSLWAGLTWGEVGEAALWLPAPTHLRARAPPSALARPFQV